MQIQAEQSARAKIGKASKTWGKTLELWNTKQMKNKQTMTCN